MQRSPEKQWLLASFGLATVLMGLVNTTSYKNAHQLIESTNKSKQTYEVIKNLVDVFAEMTVAESGRRGYVFLDDEKELIRYQKAIPKIEPLMQRLHQKIDDHPEQNRRLRRLETLLTRRLTLLQWSIVLHQQNPTAIASQKHITQKSVKLREEIQQIITELQDTEEELLQDWLQRSQSNMHDRIRIEFLFALSSFSILIVAYRLLYQQLEKRQEAEAAKYFLVREKELSDLKLRFFSMASHEFRTPLSVILGSVQLLLESGEQWSPDRQKKNLHRIQSSAKSMTRLLTDILTLTRAEVGKLEVNLKPLDLESFCLNLVEEIQLSVSHSHKIQLIRQGICHYICLDEKLLYSILSNLLENAMKYSSPEEPIELILDCQPEKTVFQVNDRGMGISAVDQSQLFEPFHRGQNAQAIRGTGLGLAVVKACVDRLGGEIKVESRIGTGTNVIVTLPKSATGSRAARD